MLCRYDGARLTQLLRVEMFMLITSREVCKFSLTRRPEQSADEPEKLLRQPTIATALSMAGATTGKGQFVVAAAL